VPVLVGEIEHQEPLPRDVEPMNPHKVVEDPPCGGGLGGCALLVRQGGLVLLERVADARLSSRIDEHTDRQDHQQRHDPFGFLQLQRRGQQLRGLEEAKPAFGSGWAFIAVEPRVGG
jgi:hypothetical protein